MVTGPIKFHHTVQGIRAITEGDVGIIPGELPPVEAVAVKYSTRDANGNPVLDGNGRLQMEEREYDHVITTIPLTTLRTLDIDQARLNFKQASALRTLQYGPSIKVGIRFNSAWWLEHPSLGIKGGQSYSDRCVRTVVYPSYGLPGPGMQHPTTVLIASYCWTHDAIRMGALIGSGEEADMRLKDLVLRDLAVIHNLEYDYLLGEYVDHFAFDWTHDPYTQGGPLVFRRP